jgi:hypothetical protein
METVEIVSLNDEEIEELLSPYKTSRLFLDSANLIVSPPDGISLSAQCLLPPKKPGYLEKEIDYVTATEGLGLVTRCFILMFVVALTRRLLPDLRSSNRDICKDPEVFTLSVEINCKKRIQRNVGSKTEKSSKPILVKVWLEKGWSIEKRRGKLAFRGRVKFLIEEGRWDGSVETFIWLE